MAWGFRRSLKLAGPLRLNFSKSGLGLSLGVPGLHVGVNSRGRYVRAGIPGTGIYYRKGLGSARPKPAAVAAPSQLQRQTPWMAAVRALLDGNPQRCLEVLGGGTLGNGPVVHIEVGDDVVVTLSPDACGVAVLRAEALDRLGRRSEALAVVDAAVADDRCNVAEIVATELRHV